MGLFNFFRNNQQTGSNDGENKSESNLDNNRVDIDIPRDTFIDESDPQENSHQFGKNGKNQGIEIVYAFLEADYEPRGYNDSLINPDDSYKSDNIKLLKLDLSILIQKINTYYEDILKDLDLHIGTRGRAGLIDLVEELKTKKEMVLHHVEKVNQIRNEIEKNTGNVERIVLSYQRGFMRGLSALSQSNVLAKKL